MEFTQNLGLTRMPFPGFPAQQIFCSILCHFGVYTEFGIVPFAQQEEHKSHIIIDFGHTPKDILDSSLISCCVRTTALVFDKKIAFLFVEFIDKGGSFQIKPGFGVVQF